MILKDLTFNYGYNLKYFDHSLGIGIPYKSWIINTSYVFQSVKNNHAQISLNYAF